MCTNVWQKIVHRINYRFFFHQQISANFISFENCSLNAFLFSWKKNLCLQRPVKQISTGPDSFISHSKKLSIDKRALQTPLFFVFTLMGSSKQKYLLQKSARKQQKCQNTTKNTRFRKIKKRYQLINERSRCCAMGFLTLLGSSK